MQREKRQYGKVIRFTLMQTFRVQRGFTLVELLISALIMPILVMAVGSVYIHIIHQNAKGLTRLDLHREGNFAIEMMTRNIREAMGNSIEINDVAIGQEIRFRKIGDDDFSRFYVARNHVKPKKNVNYLYYEHPDPDNPGSIVRERLAGNVYWGISVYDIRFYEDNPDNPSFVNIYLFMRDPDQIVYNESSSFTATVKWRN